MSGADAPATPPAAEVVEPVVDVGGVDGGAPFVPGAGPGDAERVLDPITFDPKKVAAMLRTATGKADELVGDRAQASLEMTELEAKLVAPGIVRYLEARPSLAHAVQAGGNEYLQMAVGLGMYGVRVARERAKAIAAGDELDASAGVAELTPTPTPEDPNLPTYLKD